RATLARLLAEGARAQARPFFAAPLPAEPEQPVAFADFERFWRHPARSLLRARLGIVLLDAQAELVDTEPFELDYAGSDALAERVRVAILDDEARGRVAQERLERLRRLHDGQRGERRIEIDIRIGLVETHVVAEHQPIFVDRARLAAAKARVQQRNAPPDQPAREAVDDDEIGRIREHLRRVRAVAMHEAQPYALGARVELRVQIVEHAVHEVDRARERAQPVARGERRLAHRDEAAAAHRV
ncbi:hypothetical protein ACN4GL_22615, partial [Burkholderia pseudomallei]